MVDRVGEDRPHRRRTQMEKLARLKMLSMALTQFVENSNDAEDRCEAEQREVELAEAELDAVNIELVELLGV